MGSRAWIKMHCDPWLSGNIRYETPQVRGIFADFLALAGSGKYGDIGQIKLQNEVGFTDLQLQKLLKITRKQLLNAKKQLVLIGEIAIDGDNIITITNWKKYQSEYNRQKPYRNSKLQPEVTPEITREKENKNKKENKKDDPDKYIKGKYGHIVQR